MPMTELPTLEAMVVDDDAEICELLAEHLRFRGLLVTTERDGREAVTTLMRSGGCYSIVLTDINMPGADGFDVLRAAHRANPSASVVVVTGYASLDTAIQAVRLGAHDYITKPFSLGQIDVVLRNAGDRLALERENRKLAAQVATARLSGSSSQLDAIERRLARIETLLSCGRRD
jgi:DNA-binding NtrC family response regulator